MTYPAIDPLSELPGRGDAPDNYTLKSDAFFNSLLAFRLQLMALAEYLEQLVADSEQINVSALLENRIMSPSLVALFRDAEGNVPLWLEGGKLNATALAEPLLAQLNLEELRLFSAGLYPILTDAQGNVPLWLEQGKLGLTAFSESALDQLNLAEAKILSGGYLPLLKDAAGNVPMWLENGRLNVTGLAIGLRRQFCPAVASRTDLPIATDGRTLFLWRMQTAKHQRDPSQKLKVAITGDSWTEYVAIPQVLADKLYTALGQRGEGWVSVNNQGGGPYLLNDMTFSKSGWTNYDASSGDLPVYGTGIDGQYSFTTGTSAVLNFANARCTNIDIYYRNHGGTFNYSVDGASPVSVTATSAGTLGKVSITGLSLGFHSLAITTTGNTGTVVICGFRAWDNTSGGCEVIKCGNAGLDSVQLQNFVNYIAPIAADVAPDLVLVFLGTNDYRREGPSPDQYKTGLAQLIAQYRTASPNCGFIFIAPPDSNGAAITPLTAYRDALYQLCLEQRVEFYNAHDDWPSFSTANALGLWADTLHLNEAGANLMIRSLIDRFSLLPFDPESTVLE